MNINPLPSAYVGRFAPSPSGPLHAGSLIAAMASYLDARVHGGRWLLRIEDIDTARTVAGAANAIEAALHTLGMHRDGPLLVQSERQQQYRAACERLGALVYPCGCSRKEIVDSRLGLSTDGSAVYPGTCRQGLTSGKNPRALRIRVPAKGQEQECIRFKDRWYGWQSQHLSTQAGDFVLHRADGFWSYQLAVVVDDAEQGVTHVVRGADLLDSSARQIYLQQLLGYPTPTYLHVPLLRHPDGAKFSKQNGAPAIDLTQPLKALYAAAAFLGLPMQYVSASTASSVTAFWQQAVPAWRHKLQSLPASS